MHSERLGQAGAGAGGLGLGDVALLVIDADDLQPVGGHQRRVRRPAQRSAGPDANIQHTRAWLQPPKHLRVPALSHVDDDDVVNLRGFPSREQDEEDEDGCGLEEHSSLGRGTRAGSASSHVICGKLGYTTETRVQTHDCCAALAGRVLQVRMLYVGRLPNGTQDQSQTHEACAASHLIY